MLIRLGQYARELGMKWVLFISLIPQVVFATVTAGKIDCPTQFEGRVNEVIEPIGVSSGFETNTVAFTNNRTIKGEVKDRIFLEILKNGPFDIEQGEDYLVQLRDGKVCWIEKL